MNCWDDGNVPKYVRSENPGSGELDAFATPISREIARLLALSGPTTSQDVADRLEVSNLTVHRTLIRLENLGIMEGSPPPDNRNGRRVTWSLNLDRAEQVTRTLADFISGK